MKIGIFATSLPALATEPKKLYGFLESKGLEVYEHPQVRIHNGYLAGTIKERVDAIHEMAGDPSINVLMAFWGGANSNQLLPYLDYELLRRANKPIIGYSDTTALLLAVRKFSDITTYMGPAAISFIKPEPIQYSYECFKEIFIDQKKKIEIKDSLECADDIYYRNPDPSVREVKKNSGRKVFKNGHAKGEIVAANLQTLLVLAGTKYFPDLNGKILFIEEAEDESAAMIHRFFTHLSQVCDLKQLKGICIGRFCESSGFNADQPEEGMYRDVFADLNIPIIYNLDFGHSDPLFTIPIGAQCEINGDQITFLLS